MSQKHPISAIVASCNEGHILEDCLKSLSFCDEIVGVNMECDDNSEEIFKKYVTSYCKHKRVPIIEEIHPVFIPKLKNDWFIVIDPDERIMPELATDIIRYTRTVEPNIAVIRVPMFNHFKGKKLNYTVFGGLIYFRMLYRRSGVQLNNNVHVGIKLKEGFDRIKIPYNGLNYDQHFWCNGWAQLLAKHNRYLKKEGQAKYNLGLRYSFRKQVTSTLINFYYSYKTKRGYKLGLVGLFLSLISCRYEFLTWRSLKKFQKDIN